MKYAQHQSIYNLKDKFIHSFLHYIRILNGIYFGALYSLRWPRTQTGMTKNEAIIMEPRIAFSWNAGK